MPNSVSRLLPHPYPVGDVFRAITSREYWVERVTRLDGEDAYLVSFEFDGTTTHVHISKPVPTGRMPAPLAKLIPPSVRMDVHESWGSLVDGRSAGQMRADVTGAPVTVTANLLLRREDDVTAVMELDGRADARIPVVGRALGSAIADDVGNEMAAIGDFTIAWLAAAR
ncbi:DUF2505 domain-containing protein [Nocardia sp. BSTN01]|uniref:DUF2505 domain-containing protein n=1 Tax=Nocardia sp. BSTN01 TaxID=2783665 RepID=UPI0018905754|nr:DUF2505 domain-containing protein [Nocardia sp. BSTN01]MBF5002500.1 DUF2505 domain-containing protein [Nocardia sp. BSTN01]